MRCAYLTASPPRQAHDANSVIVCDLVCDCIDVLSFSASFLLVVYVKTMKALFVFFNHFLQTSWVGTHETVDDFSVLNEDKSRHG